MTPRFRMAIDYVLAHEGGFNDIKGDAGGATNWGVSLRFLKTIKEDVNHDGVVDWKDIRDLDKEEAIEIYWDNFWRPLYDKLPARIGMKVFDVAVNAGHSRAHILLQKTLNGLGSKVQVDGIVGSQTLKECARYSDKQLVDTYCTFQAAFYRSLVDAKPTQAKFLKGWLNRAAWKPK